MTNSKSHIQCPSLHLRPSSSGRLSGLALRILVSISVFLFVSPSFLDLQICRGFNILKNITVLICFRPCPLHHIYSFLFTFKYPLWSTIYTFTFSPIPYFLKVIFLSTLPPKTALSKYINIDFFLCNFCPFSLWLSGALSTWNSFLSFVSRSSATWPGVTFLLLFFLYISGLYFPSCPHTLEVEHLSSC